MTWGEDYFWIYIRYAVGEHEKKNCILKGIYV